MYAIVATGGKQYKVAAGDVLEIEKLDAAPGESVSLDVIFVADGDAVITEADALASATVKAEVIEHFKGEKAVIFKFKKRKGYKRLKGHRQELTRIRVLDVTAGAKKKATKKADVAAEAPVEAVAE